jgi:Lon-like protease
VTSPYDAPPPGPISAVTPPYAVAPDPPTGPTSRGWTIIICGFATVVCLAVIGLVPAPYAILGPGPATNTLGTMNNQKLIQVTGHATYPATGSLDFTTVRIYGGPGTRLSLFNAMQAWLSKTRAVIPEDQEFPKGQTSQQIDQQNAQDMTTSQEDAATAALRELGIQVPEVVTITGVTASAPAAAVLRTGDIVTSIDGATLVSNDQLHAAIEKHQPGDVLRVGLKRGGKDLVVRAKTIKDGTRTLLGITVGITFRMPFTVKIDTHDVGGPSAGTMFALGVYDTLTPGSLTGGKRIAGTGTIDPETGDVGIIGGIAQKMVGAKNDGAQWFLAPAANCSDVRGHVPSGLRVVKDSTLHQARLYVQQIAAGKGSTLPTC